MNQLSGRYLVIVLSIREGRGFKPTANLLSLEGTLNGRKIVSDPAEATNTPFFCTDLVWEIEKKDIRKLRSSHTHLRIECYSTDSFGEREKIGFLLLHLRSAIPIPSDQSVTAEYRWNKLLGVNLDHKATHPELALTLTIRDKLGEITPIFDPPITDQTIPEEVYKEDSQARKPDFSVLYVEEGFIQIGDAELCSDSFTLTFLLETACNMDLLLPKNPIFPTETKYSISITCFDLSIKSKNFYKNLHEPVTLNDKITFKLHSNIDHLTTFFDKHEKVSLNFYQGTEVLGTSSIELKQFNPKDFLIDPNNFETNYEQNCLFKSVETNKIPDANGRKPFVTTKTILIKNKTEPKPKTPIQVQDERKYITDIKCQGDQIIEKVPVIPKTLDSSAQTSARSHRVLRSTYTNLKDVSLSNVLHTEICTLDQNYHLYSLTTNLRSVVWKSAFSENFQFKFRHPKANTVLIIQCNIDDIEMNELITLEDVKCRQFFVTTPSFIATLIYTYPCKVQICDENNKALTEEFELYTKLFLAHNTKISEGIEGLTSTYYAIVNAENNPEDIVAELQIEMVLIDLGFNVENYVKTCFDLEPITLDEKLSFQTLKELENWKGTMQKLYEERQKFIENERLKILNEDWEKKREDLEKKLQTGIERCRILSEELIIASRDVQNKKKYYDQQQIYRENPEIIEMKVTEMIEAELNQKIDQLRRDNIELLDKIVNMQKEQITFKEEIKKKEDEYEDLKRTTLTQDQTKTLFHELRCLEEKYRQEQNAKTFFKEQWQKTVREVHLLKSKDQKQIQMQIKKKKIELSQLSLNDFDKLSSDDSETSLMSCPGSGFSSNAYVY